MRSALLDLMLGSEAKQRLRLARTLGACAVFAICLLIQFAAVSAGKADLIAAAALWGFIVIGLSCFYMVIRTGRSLHLHDPALTMLQALFAILSLTLAYAINPFIRGMMPMLMALVLVFCAFILPPRRCRQLGWVAVLALAIVMLACSTRWPVTFEPRTEAFHFVLSALVLPVVAILAGQLSGIRRQLQAQKRGLREALEKVRKLAAHDELTGLPNRRRALEILASEARKPRRTSGSLCICIIDIDHFKVINDQQGHQAGDDALCLFTNIMSRHLRTGDVLTRWGGEEFMLLLSATALEEAGEVIERLALCCANAENWVLRPELQVTFSAGLSTFVAGDPSYLSVVARADAALYQAKRAGRNRLITA